MADEKRKPQWTMGNALGTAPSGLTQQREAFGDSPRPEPQVGVPWTQQGTVASAPGQPRWTMGGQTGTTRSGWDTDFYERMFNQQREAAESGTLGEVFSRPDFTGVVTYDGQRDSSGRMTRFGDVYEDGRLTGNTYEMYAKPEADFMMAEITLDDRTRQRAYQRQAEGDSEIVGSLVQAKREEVTEGQERYRTQADYEDRVDAQREEFENTGIFGDATDEILTAVGGFAGGVAATWWAGPWSLLGGAIGAGAALLNQDSLLDQAARAKVQQDMAGEEFGLAAGVSTGLMGWSGLAGQFISPLSNLVHGAYDASAGSVGDGVVEWYERDAEGKGGPGLLLQGVGLAAGLGDAAMQFASPVGRSVYWTQMSGYIGGSVGQMGVTGGHRFSDSRGTFVSTVFDDEGNFDPLSAAAGVASVGIEAVQVGGRFGVTRALRRQTDAAGAGLAGQITEAGGRRFRLDESGTAQWLPGSIRSRLGLSDKAASAQMSLLAPSESLQALSARVVATRAARARGERTFTADDYYRAANDLAQGTTTWGNALVMGVGEGYEEFAQAVLDPISTRDQIDWRQAGMAGAQGFAMGTGMRLGVALGRTASGVRAANADDRAYARAVLSMRSLGADPKASMEDVLPRAQWDSLSASQKAALSELSPQQRELNIQALTKIAEEQRAGEVANVAGIEKATDAIQRQAANEQNRAQTLTDGSYVIIAAEDADTNPEAVTASFDQVAKLLTQHVKGLAEQADYLDRNGDSDGAAVLTTTREQAELLTQAVTNLRDQASAAREAGERVQFNRAVDRANEVLAAAFYDGRLGADATAELVEARQRAATIVFARFPTDQGGSFPPLVPQVSREMAWDSDDNALAISRLVLQAIGGDHDGDKIVSQTQLVLDSDAFADLRSGRHLVGVQASTDRDFREPGEAAADPATPGQGYALGSSPRVNIGTFRHEIHEIDVLAGALHAANSAVSTEAAAAIGRLTDRLRTRYAEVIPAAVLDPILTRLEGNLRTGVHDAKDQLLTDLVDQAGNELFAFARKRRSNELLWAAVEFQRTLQHFQRFNASTQRTENPDINSQVVTSVPRTSARWTLLQQQAATEGQTLGLEAPGWSLFRMFQKLHYSVLNAAVVSATPEALTGTMAEFSRDYEVLSQQVTRSAMEATGARDHIAQKVGAMLRSMVADADAPGRALATVANIAVADVEIAGDIPRVGDKPITMLQLLLRQVINEDRHDNANAVTPDLEMKWARLEQLTRPGASGEAFVEVLGSTTLWELLGEHSTALGPQLTVEQWVRLYAAQGPQARKVASQRLRMEPAYGSREGMADLPYSWEEVAGGQITTYRAATETMLEAGNKRITLKEDGTAGGRLGEQSDKYHAALVEALDTARTAITELGRTPSKESVRELFDMDPGFARQVLDLVPDAWANALFEVIDDRLHVSNWVYEMLAAEPEHGAMIYLRNITMTQWFSMGARHIEANDGDPGRTYSKLTNRLHQVMFRLAHSGDGGMALAEFQRELGTAKDVRSFMRYLNTQVRLTNEQPFTAWLNDTADFSPDKAGGGWTSVSDGAQVREAILALRDRSERLLADVRAERATEEVDVLEASSLLSAIRAGEAAAPADRKRLARLEQALEMSKERLTALGPNAMLQQLVTSQRTFYGHAHDKGTSPEHVLPLGAFQALDDVPGFATQFERLRDVLISVDDIDLGANAQTLARDAVDTMDAQGAIAAWEGLSAEGFLNLWTTRPETRSLLRAMVFPSVYEATPSGRLAQQYVTGNSLKSLLDSGAYETFFQPSAESRLTYLSSLESRAKQYRQQFVAQRSINDILLAHTASATTAMTTAEHESRVWEMSLDMAEIGRLVGELYVATGADGQGLRNVREQLAQELASRTDTASMMARSQDKEAARQVYETLLIERVNTLNEAVDLALQAGDTQRAEALTRYRDRFESKTRAVLNHSDFETFRESHRIPWEDEASVNQAKMDLREYVVERSQILLTKAPWATEAIQRAMAPLRFIDGVPVLSADPRTDTERWDVLTDAVTAAYMEDATSIQAEGLAVPELSWDKAFVRRYWDPTYSYLLEFLKPESAFAKAARDMHLAHFGPNDAGDVSAELVSKLRSSVLDADRLGPWTADIARVSIEANQRMDSSAAGDAVAMAGIAPRRQFTVATATQRTTLSDTLAATTSTGRVSLAELTAGRGQVVTELVTEDGQVPGVTNDLLMLNGRFARGARLMHGTTEVANLWTQRNLGSIDLTRREVAESGYRAITVRQLRRAAEAALPSGVKLDELSVEIDYLHPDSQPARAGYYNNVFYEGLVYEGNADTAGSLIEAGWFGTGGLSPEGQASGLGASKKGKLAYAIAPSFTAEARRRAEDGWTTDFSGMLERKTVALMTTDLGNGKLDPTLYNMVRKDVKLRHFVRGTLNGQQVLWTAEQVIAWQRANPGQDISLHLKGAELWKPTARVLRTMLGETGDQGHPGALQLAFNPDPARVTRYQGITPEILSRVPRWDRTTDLFSTAAVHKVTGSRWQMRPILTSAERAAMDQGLAYRSQLRAKVWEARNEKWPETKASANAQSALQIVNAALNAETPGMDFSSLGFPFITQLSQVDKQAARLVLGEFLESITLSGRETGWVYREYYGGKMPDPASGVLSQIQLDPNDPGFAEPQLQNQVAPDDLVAVELSSFSGTRDPQKRQELIERRLTALAGRDPVIALVHERGEREARVLAGRHLESLGYEKVAGTKHLYRRRQRDTRFQTREARISTLTATHTEPATNLMVAFLTNQNTPLPMAENGALWVSRDQRRTIAMPSSLVPVNAYGSFGLPQGRDMAARTKASVEQLLEPTRFAHLLSLSKIEDGSTEATELRAAIQHYLEVAGPDGLPMPGTEFGTGDILPLIDRQGRMLLYRHGMRPPKSIDGQLRSEIEIETDTGPAGIAIYGTTPEPNATTYTGTVVSFERDNQYGLQVRLRVPLQQVADKIQFENNGMKYVLSSRGEKVYLPDHELFPNGVGVDLMSNLDDALNKESIGGLANNYRNAFAFFGVDFTPELYSFFFGKQYDQLSADDRRVAHTMVSSVLDQINDASSGLSPAVVEDLMEAPFLDQVVSDQLAAAQLSELVAGWESQLDVPAEQLTVEQKIGRAAVLYMLMPQAEARHIVRAGGVGVGDVRADDSQTVFMPRIFTEAFDREAPGSELRRHLSAKLNSQINNADAAGDQWYWLRPDLTFVMRNSEGVEWEGYLQFVQAHSSGDNPVLNGQAMDRGGRDQNWSRHSMDIGYEAIGALTAARDDALPATSRFAELRTGISKGSLWQVLTDSAPDDSTPLFLRERPAEKARRQMAYEAVGTFREAIDTANWTEQQRNDFEVARNRVARKFGLAESQAEVVDYWIRQMGGIWLDPHDTEGRSWELGYDWAQQLLTEVEWNADHHLLPIAGGEVPMLHVFDLSMLYEANSGPDAEWYMVEGPGSQTRVTSWEEWVSTALGTAHIEHTVFDPLYLLATDGFMHSYQGALDSLVSMPVSLNMLVNAGIMDASSDQLVQSLDPDTDLLARDPMVLDTAMTSFADLMGAERVAGQLGGRRAPNTVLSQRRAERMRWRKENGVPFPVDVTMANFRDKGATFRQETASAHALLRMASNLRAGNALFNPLLWAAAGPELFFRSVLDTATNVLMGQSTGGIGEAVTRVTSAATGGRVTGRYTPAQIAQLQELYTSLGERSDFKSMLYKDLVYEHPVPAGAGWLERLTHRYAQIGAKWQDPTYGMNGAAMARRYVEKVLEELASIGARVTPEQLAAELNRNPLWVRDNHKQAHDAAASTIASVRSLRPTLMSLALRGIYEPMAASPSIPVSVAGHLIRIPLMFSNFMSNVLTTFTGMQGFSAMATMFVEGRNKGLIGRIQSAIKGEPQDPNATFDMTEALDGVNLAKMFVQGGITHTGLFAMGLMASGLGLSGEDEEERRRRIAAQTTGGQFLYDPRRIQNDFRNTEAVFMDWLPPFVSSWFELEGTEGLGSDEARSMANLPWILKQFISPIIGMERFFNTGDPNQILWGFQDAVGSMPIFNSTMFDSAARAYAELMGNADEAARRGTPQDLTAATGFMISAIGTMERMLFENSFLNMLYVGLDRYDRDQWKRPLLDSERDQQFDALGNPRTTGAMTTFQDPETGEWRQGYTNREWSGAMMRQLTESRLTLGLLSSLISGKGTDSDFWRYNMPIKERTLDKAPLTLTEAEGLLLSVLDSESYGATLEGAPGDIMHSEVLTEEGARAVFRGLYAGTVEFGSPALEGMYIDLETRQAISEKWMAELVAEGLEMGLRPEQAESRMWDIWMGKGDSPYKVGINDILWSREEGSIPYTQQVRYNQLNSLYVLGPDGLPYVTGVTRDGLHNLFGLLPARYYSSADTNLGVDGRLNATDALNRLNTGMRALERKEDAWFVPTEEEIGQRIEKAVENLGDRMDDLLGGGGNGSGWVNYPRRGWTNYGRRSGGGYGGGSSGYWRGGTWFDNFGGQAQRMNTPRRVRSANADDLYSINTSNPIIRRASIRRERFSSTRGRLNQWQ